MLALALHARGRRATVIDPAGLSSSPNTLCAFADQVPVAFRAEEFPTTVVVTEEGELDLHRAYARIDTARLARDAAGVVDVAIDHVNGSSDDGRLVRTGRGTFDAGVIVDISGHRPLLVAREQGTQTMQSAFGLIVRGVDDALPPGTALFMDWRSSGVDDGGPPSFLYALSGSDGRLLLEETTLASSAPVSAALLKRRLAARLRRRGTRIDVVVDEEHVAFSMGAGLPRRRQAVAAFGAAAGLVQPVSGYSIARAFAAAPAVAAAIDAGMGREAAPIDIADDVNEALWPPPARDVRRLQRFGLSALCAFDAAENNAFFAAFFSLPADQWRGYLDGDADVTAIRATMWRLFRAVPARIRRRLVTGARFTDTVDALLSTTLQMFRRPRAASVEGGRP